MTAPLVADLPELKLNILAALWRAYPSPLSLSELYVNCRCEGPMTAYGFALLEMGFFGWIYDTTAGPLKSGLTAEGRMVILSLVASGQSDKFGVAARGNGNNVAGSLGCPVPDFDMEAYRAGYEFAAQCEPSDPWTRAHERVFGIKPLSPDPGERAGNAFAGSAAMTSPGIHLVAGHLPIVKTQEPCVTCCEPTTKRCGNCDGAICNSHGYGENKNLCSVCKGNVELEQAGELSHGRADVR